MLASIAIFMHQINGDFCLRPQFCAVSYTEPVATWAYEMNFDMNHL